MAELEGIPSWLPDEIHIECAGSKDNTEFEAGVGVNCYSRVVCEKE